MITRKPVSFNDLRLILRKLSADQTYNNNQTATKIDDWSDIVLPPGNYIINCWVMFESSAAADIRFNFVFNGGTVSGWVGEYGTQTGSTGNAIAAGHLFANGAGAAVVRAWIVTCNVKVTTQTTLECQAAQTLAEVSDTIIHEESGMEIKKLG